ncbi:MAG: Rne/Rng family ribonuclease [Clostridia bacterium]
MARRRRRRWGILPALPTVGTAEAAESLPADAETETEGAEKTPEPKPFKELLLNFGTRYSRLAVLEDSQLVEFYIERDEGDQAAGNIYKGRVENVLPGMRAAFVNVGLDKNAFLYVDDAAAPEKGARHRPIQEVLKVGQDIIVQVVKEPIGTKGARITTNLSLPGRYVVLTPYSETIGVSRRIEDPVERDRLRTIAEKIRPRGMGIIVRTVAQGASQRALQRDLAYLRRLLARVRHKAKITREPGILHREVGLIMRTVRDQLDDSVDRFIVDDPQAFERAQDVVTSLSPQHKDRLQLWQDERPLFEVRGVEAELDRAVKRRIWLKCGGYLVIDETEALTVIDVNTGKNVGTTDLADTVLQTNREAAVEIARQLRLRDISGIVLVDFIDMETEEHQADVIRTFQRALKSDRTRVTVLGLTRLGLLEMTRKKVHESLLSQLTRMCGDCEGRGRVLSEEVVAQRLRERITDRLRESGAEAILAEAHPSVASHLIGPGGANLRELERSTGRSVYIRGAADCTSEELRVRVLGTRQEVERQAFPVREGERLKIMVEERHATNSKNGIARVEGYVIDIEGAGHRVGERVEIEVQRALRTFATAKLVAAAEAMTAMAQEASSSSAT